ncbi:MAG: hypothetical protein KDA84_10435, partial [Planctomycetaceae bacterium]|nr:hypothetical protein [Planctomycetaceae bacterium]
MRIGLARWWCWVLLFSVGVGAAHSADKEPIRTFFVTRSLTHEKLVPYLSAARPQVVQIGNYGAMFHGYADNKKSTGWPMQLPVVGEREALAYQKRLNKQAHEMGSTVVGHFRLVKAMGHWKEQTGFVEYYDKHWPTELLGPKPHPKLEELLQRDSKGEPIQLGRYNQSHLAFCLSSPHARQMFKQMLKVAIDQDIDGVITTFNYNFECSCPHCQKAFKGWLKDRLTPEELQTKLGIKNLDEHTFEKIPARIGGYPDVATATELDWLAMRWGAVHFKKMFDEIFLDYGRSLRKDLLVAQWNHLSHVSDKEERMFLPLELYGRGEDYFWYSGGAAFVGKNLNLQAGKAGDAWLSCLYVREMTGGKPFVMGKYDRTRLAVSMAEGYATGGMGMGRYMRFEEPAGFDVLVKYTRFRHRYRHHFDSVKPLADAALVLPRQSVWNRKPESLADFRELGQALVERQALIDVLADENITAERLSNYPAVILSSVVSLSDEQLAALRDYATNGGLVLIHGDVGTMNEQGHPRKDGSIPQARKLASTDTQEMVRTIEQELSKRGCSEIEAPWTVRASAYTQGSKTILHLVNYDREEEAPENNRTGPETERPKPVKNIRVRLPIPKDRQVCRVTLYSPGEEPVKLPILA